MESQSEIEGLSFIADKDMRILSVGISTGGEAEIKMLRSNPDRTVVATTLDQEGLEKVRTKIEGTELSSRLELRLEDIASEKLEYEENSFDFIYARLVLHYLSAQKLLVALASLHKILKHGGSIFVVVRSSDIAELKTTPFLEYDEDTCLTTYQNPSGGRATRYFHTIESISGALISSGFIIQKVDKFDEKLSPNFNRDSDIWVLNNVIEVLATKG
ncbi:MAG: methyltransferase domain-containing protein [Candidatus Saccharimonadales bacterium]